MGLHPTKQAHTWNPIRINFQHIWVLMQDAWRAKSWWDKCRIWFMPTGWRPEDVQAAYPIEYADHRNFVKYDSKPTSTIKLWSWVQFLMMNIFLIHMLVNIANISETQLFIYAAYVFLMIYSYSALMDKDPNAIWMEAIKSLVGLAIVFIAGTWFGIDDIISNGTLIVAVYQFFSAAVVAYIVIKEIGWKMPTELNIQSQRSEVRE